MKDNDKGNGESVSLCVHLSSLRLTDVDAAGADATILVKLDLHKFALSEDTRKKERKKKKDR